MPLFFASHLLGVACGDSTCLLTAFRTDTISPPFFSPGAMTPYFSHFSRRLALCMGGSARHYLPAWWLPRLAVPRFNLSAQVAGGRPRAAPEGLSRGVP